MIGPGFAFRSARPPYSTEHLYIVISPVIEEKVLFVNVTTRTPVKDATCVLRKGDHPFIRHESVINYVDAVEAEVCRMREAIERKLFKPHDALTPALLKKIQDGALASPAFKPKFKKYIPK